MPLNKYTAYYNYLEKNWNKKIATHIIASEKIGEEKFGINTTGVDLLKNLKKEGVDISHSTIYMPAPYDMLQYFFEQIKINSFKHFLDIGCGKGRAMCVAASYGIKKISGIEFSKALFTTAEKNCLGTKKYFPKTKFKLYHNDAFYFKIEKEVDCIFMFNPFDAVIMSGVLENIEISLAKHPRKITIVYFNPIDKKMLLQYGYSEVLHYKKRKYLEAVVLVKDNNLPIEPLKNKKPHKAT
jgi:16S rRNA G966 N2-methylase RsmD